MADSRRLRRHGRTVSQRRAHPFLARRLMDFNLSDVQQSWRAKGESLGKDLLEEPAAADVVMGAARVGLIDPGVDLLAAAAAVEALATASSSAAAITLALHTGILLSLGADDRFTSLARGETVGAIALSTDEVPAESNGRLTGRASLVGPLTDRGLAIVGARSGDGLLACAVALDTPGTTMEPMRTAALRGFVRRHGRITAAERAPRRDASVHDARAHPPGGGWPRDGTPRPE